MHWMRISGESPGSLWGFLNTREGYILRCRHGGVPVLKAGHLASNFEPTRRSYDEDLSNDRANMGHIGNNLLRSTKNFVPE